MKRIFTILILCVLFACNNKPDRLPFSGLTINIKTNNNESAFSTIARNTKFITLETNPNSLIGQITKVLIYKSKIFILDSFHAKSLKVFSEDGKFLYKIGEAGFSDGELFIPSDFSINYSNDELSLLNNGSSISTYDINGKFIRNKKISKIGPFKFEILTDGFAFIGGGRNENLILTDENMLVKERYYPFVDPYLDKLLIDVFQKLDDTQTIYRRNLNDTIFTVSNSSLSPRLVFNFEGKKITYEDAVNGTVSKDEIAQTYRVKYYYETKDFVYTLFTYKDVPYLSLYSKLSKKIDVLKYTSMKNDVTFERFGNIILGADYNSNRLIFQVLPSSILKDKESIINNSTADAAQKEKVIALMSGLTLASNPVLGIVNLK